MADIGTVIAINMRRERSHRKWRQKDLAEYLGWPLSRVTRMECGAQRVQVTDARDLCQVFEIPLLTLLKDAEPTDLAALRLPNTPDLPTFPESPESPHLADHLDPLDLPASLDPADLPQSLSTAGRTEQAAADSTDPLSPSPHSDLADPIDLAEVTTPVASIDSTGSPESPDLIPA